MVQLDHSRMAPGSIKRRAPRPAFVLMVVSAATLVVSVNLLGTSESSAMTSSAVSSSSTAPATWSSNIKATLSDVNDVATDLPDLTSEINAISTLANDQEMPSSSQVKSVLGFIDETREFSEGISTHGSTALSSVAQAIPRATTAFPSFAQDIASNLTELNQLKAELSNEIDVLGEGKQVPTTAPTRLTQSSVGKESKTPAQIIAKDLSTSVSDLIDGAESTGSGAVSLIQTGVQYEATAVANTSATLETLASGAYSTFVNDSPQIQQEAGDIASVCGIGALLLSETVLPAAILAGCSLTFGLISTAAAVVNPDIGTDQRIVDVGLGLISAYGAGVAADALVTQAVYVNGSVDTVNGVIAATETISSSGITPYQDDVLGLVLEDLNSCADVYIDTGQLCFGSLPPLSDLLTSPFSEFLGSSGTLFQAIDEWYETLNVAVINGAALDVVYSGQQAELTFSGTDGESIQAAVTDVEMSDDGCYDLELVGPQGSGGTGTESCSGNGSSAGIGPFTLPATGTWAILLILDPTATGTSSAWVSAPASVGSIAVNGASAALNVVHPTQMPELTFSGTDGESIQAAVTDVEMSDDGCYDLELVGPQGSGGTGTESCSGNGSSAGIGPFTLPATGTWAILLILDPTATGTSSASVKSPKGAHGVPAFDYRGWNRHRL
jgi:hypothetical protein